VTFERGKSKSQIHIWINFRRELQFSKAEKDSVFAYSVCWVNLYHKRERLNETKADTALIADSIGLQVVANIIIEQSSYTRVFQYLENVRSTLLSPYSFSNQAGIEWEVYDILFLAFLIIISFAFMEHFCVHKSV
jgi:hypothetical protein